MNLDLVVMWIVVGLMVGLLAGYVIRGGGYGLVGDIVLGLAGSIVGSGIFQAWGAYPDAGNATLVLVAFIGAAVTIVAQRQFWYVRLVPPRIVSRRRAAR